MKATEIKFTKKISTGDYENEELSVTIAPTSKPLAEQFEELKAEVYGCLGLELAASEEEIEETQEEETEEEETETEESEEESEEETEEEEQEEVVEKKPKRKSRSKATTYDRASSLHKKLVGEFINEQAPGWHKDKAKVAAVTKVSEKMADVDFLDADGEVIEEFRAQFMKLLKSMGKKK